MNGQLLLNIGRGINRGLYTAIDVFAGAGGLSLGLRAAGFRVLAAIEKVESCVATYRRNHPGTTVIHRDVRQVKDREIAELVKPIAGNGAVDLVVGGPPCETFSTAGPGIRQIRDHRDTLFHELIRIAKAVNARYILIENIPGLMTKKGVGGEKGGVFKELLHALVNAGFYRFDFRILDAADFGVPQHRNRLFILATSTQGPLRFPAPTHGPNRAKPWVTVAEALGDLPPLSNNEEVDFYASEPLNEYQKIMRCSPGSPFSLLGPEDKHSGDRLSLHRAPKHRPGTVKRFKLIRPGEGLRDLMVRLSREELEELKAKGILPNRWYIQRNRRLILKEPSFTVTSHCLDELLHPTQDRHLSPREAARLQSFPDWYSFEGPWVIPHIYEQQDKYEQIGDAVPPLLALAIGRELIRCLDAVEGTEIRESSRI